jgi:predicted permease
MTGRWGSLSRYFDSVRADAVFGTRRLVKHKVTSTAAILSLALAIGACIAAFQLVDALWLRPLPVAGAERLYSLSRNSFSAGGTATSFDNWEYPLFRRMRDGVAAQATVLAISYAERVDLTFASDAETEKAHVQYVSGGMFGTFGLTPAMGRLFSDDDDREPGAHPLAVLSHDYWSRRFGRDPNIVGRTFRLGNNLTGLRTYRIIGVSREGFTGTEPGNVIDIFMPSMMHWGIREPGWLLFRTFAQLHPGVRAAPVQERLSTILDGFNQERARRSPAQTLVMTSAAAGISGMQKQYRVAVMVLGVLVGLVLLIACANAANLMTAQAAARGREMALRVSMGAGRFRLAQLVLLESALLGFPAAGLAWWFAQWAAPSVAGRINPPENPANLGLHTDWRVIAFGLALTIVVTLLFGLPPAWRVSAVNPVAALKGEDDRRWRGRSMRMLIALQAAFSFVVLFGAGLFVATFERLSKVETGISVEGLINLNVVNPKDEPPALWDQVAERLRQMPGVAGVAYSDWPLLDSWGFKTNAISMNGGPPSETGAWFLNVSPGWMGTVKIPLLEGRDFRSSDSSPGSAIVNETFAKQFFGREDPIGKSFEGTSSWMRGQRFQIVGLVRDARYRFLREPNLPVAYTPFQRLDLHGAMGGGTIVVRTSGVAPLSIASMLRKEVALARPEFRVSSVLTEGELIDAQVVRERLLAILARFFGMLALLLAGVGLYGVLDYSVLQRRREIGIRMALGAQAADVAGQVTASMLGMVVLGAVAGLAVGMASVRYVSSLLYEVKATELSVLAIPALAIAGAALAAALPAAIRAVRIDPASLLRTE